MSSRGDPRQKTYAWADVKPNASARNRTDTPPPRSRQAVAKAGSGKAGSPSATVPAPGDAAPVPAVLDCRWLGFIAAFLSAFDGARFVVVSLGTLTPWSSNWYAAVLASAMSVGFGGGTLQVMIMGKRPWKFAWYDPIAVAMALVGALACMVLSQSCASGAATDLSQYKALTFTRWSSEQCESRFKFWDCVNLALLTAFGVSKSYLTTREDRWEGVRMLKALVSAILMAFGGGLLRDLVAACLGVPRVLGHGFEVYIGNLRAVFVLPTMLSVLVHHCCMQKDHIYQLGLGLPIAFLCFYGLPAELKPALVQSVLEAKTPQ